MLYKTLSYINHSKIFFDPPPRVMEINVDFNYIYLYLSFIEHLSCGPGTGLSKERTEIAATDAGSRLFIHNFNKVWVFFCQRMQEVLRRLWVGYVR